MSVPLISVNKTKQYNIKQSKYGEIVHTIPFKSVIYSPSHGGKSVLITNLIQDIYRDCFERVYIFSPSIEVDDNWRNTKKYLNEAIKISDDEPSLYQPEFNEEVVSEIMDTQKTIIEHIKKNSKSNKLFSILIVLDDVADDTSQRNSKSLKSLFVKGRHSHISVILSSQKGSLLNPVCRVNADSIYLFKLRSFQDLEPMINEFSALVGDKKEMMNTYKQAVEDKQYSFLYSNLKAKNINEMFHIRFEQYIILE